MCRSLVRMNLVERNKGKEIYILSIIVALHVNDTQCINIPEVGKSADSGSRRSRRSRSKRDDGMSFSESEFKQILSVVPTKFMFFSEVAMCDSDFKSL